MLGPFRHRAHHAAGALGGDDRLLELERIPFGDRLAHRLLFLRHVEHLQRGGAVVREIRVDVAPVPVLGRVHAHDRVALVRDLGLFHLQVMAAAQRGGGATGIDRRFLLAPGAQLPQIADREADRRQAGGAGLADLERGRQDRIAAAGDLDRAGAFLGPANDRQDRAQSVMGSHGGFLPGVCGPRFSRRRAIPNDAVEWNGRKWRSATPASAGAGAGLATQFAVRRPTLAAWQGARISAARLSFSRDVIYSACL